MERFRKSLGKQRETHVASDVAFRDAIQTGIQDAKTKQLDSSQLKEKADVVAKWIKKNINKLHLSEKEKSQIDIHKNLVYTTFSVYKSARERWDDRSRAAENFRNATQEYL